jgi:mono/diheme cytochrome c family protein
MQRRVPILRLILMVSLVASAFAQIKNPPQPAVRPVEGASIFRNNCAACHGLDGRGKGPLSRVLRQDVPDLTRLSRRNDGAFPAVHVRNTIELGADSLLPAHGSKDMPIWGPIFHEIDSDQDLGNVRLENITRFLESIQRK